MSGSGFAQFVPLILIFVIFYFFLIRPQQKKIKEHKIMVAALKRGDEVITSGGIVGKVERILGNDKVIFKPLLSLFEMLNSPECSFIILLTIGKPRPVPVFFVVKYGVITFFISVIPVPLSINIICI